MKAVIVSTWSCPLSILPAATQVIQTLRPYIIIIRSGVMDIIVLLTKSWFLYRSLLALSNHASSVSSLPNALMTCMPVRISLDTALSASTRVCMILNLGMASTKSSKAISSIAITPVTIT